MARRDAALRVVEAAYAPVAADDAWLASVVGAIDGLGLGTACGYYVDGCRVGGFVGPFPVDVATIRRACASVPEPLLRAAHAPAPIVATAVDKWGRVGRVFGASRDDLEARMGYPLPTATAMLACDARGAGVFLAVHREDVPPRARRTLAAVAAHVAAAHRLRRAVGASLVDRADAVCAPDGRVLHATGAAVAAREEIAQAARENDRARGSLRRLDPEQAIERWRALVDGRWSLVDHVERDGKRLVLALRNEVTSTMTALRGREAEVATYAALGHSDKFIAYELGLARTTIASHLRAALGKLGVSTRAELVRVFGPLARLRTMRGDAGERS